jgi:kynurenine formamidase
VWGADDELGTLNLLTDAATLVAVQTVRRGAVFPLQLPLHEPRPGVVWRTEPRHHLLHVGHENRPAPAGGADDPSAGYVDRDDYVDGLWLQGSSQWDGLTHIRHPEHGNYNGVPDADIHGGPGSRLGIDRWAERGVVGRGVVVDVAGWFDAQGDPLDLDSPRQITAAELDATLAHQGTELVGGDILLLHTGWLARLMALAPDDRSSLLDPRTQQVPGLAVERDTLAWLWDHHVAAVAADNVGVEACGPGLRFDLHPELLALLGMPLGEYWWLADLAADCRAHGTYEALLVSVPLNLRGAVGSPAQAIAIR